MMILRRDAPGVLPTKSNAVGDIEKILLAIFHDHYTAYDFILGLAVNSPSRSYCLLAHVGPGFRISRDTSYKYGAGAWVCRKT